MARPTARVLALLEILQGGGTRTVRNLADRLEVDERTLRRYVEHLRDLDVPVESVRGRYGGYRLAPGYRMPPLMLTDEEALATLLGLVVGRRTGTLAAPPVAVESAIAKLRRVLPRPLTARLDALLATVELTAPVQEPADPEVGVLLTVAGAARDGRRVVLRHVGRDGTTRDRTLEPYGVVAHRGRWYVTGRDAGSAEVRTFRLDRVVGATAADDHFTAPADVDPAATVLDALSRTPWRYDVGVRVQAPADDVKSRLTPGLAQVEPVANEPGWVRVRLHAEHLDWVPAELVRLGAPFVVEGPDELRTRVRALGEQLVAAAG